MKIAGNQLFDLFNFAKTSLTSLYDEDEIEAQFFLIAESILKKDKLYLKNNLQQRLNQSDVVLIYDLIKEISNGKPLQYALNKTWFYNLEFFVNEHVLIPRPETEELVDLVIKENKTAITVLDIGSGSGCIPISIKKNIKSATVFGVDISELALEVSKKNAKINEVEVNFFNADILSGIGLEKLNQKFDVIVSNPPYIKISEKNLMHKNVLDYEPHLALFVNGNDEIIFYKKIIDFSIQNLTKNGKLYFELNPLTADDVKEYAINKNFYKNVIIKNDMSGKERFLICSL